MVYYNPYVAKFDSSADVRMSLFVYMNAVMTMWIITPILKYLIDAIERS